MAIQITHRRTPNQQQQNPALTTAENNCCVRCSLRLATWLQSYAIGLLKLTTDASRSQSCLISGGLLQKVTSFREKQNTAPGLIYGQYLVAAVPEI